MPIVDIYETTDAFNIRAELPSVHKEDINVSADNNVLTIKGEKKQEKGPQTPSNRVYLWLICSKLYFVTISQR